MIRSLKINNLTFGYPGVDPLFMNLNCSLPLNTKVNFVGEDGSGRSTLFKILAGLKMPMSGSVLINDLPMSEMSFEEFLPFRLKIGYSFDIGGLLNNKTILENLTLPLLYHKLADESEAIAKALDLLKRFGIEKSANLRPSSVPGRTRKAAIIIRSLILNPELLILDDPTTGLSAESKQVFINLLDEYQQHNGLRHIFFVSEDVEFIQYMNATEIHVSQTLMKAA